MLAIIELFWYFLYELWVIFVGQNSFVVNLLLGRVCVEYGTGILETEFSFQSKITKTVLA